MQTYRFGRRAITHGIGASATVMLAILLAACSASTSTTSSPPTPGPLPRGQWIRPTFGGTTPITVSSVTFADGDQRVGYACTATLPAARGTPTGSATGTPTVTAATPTSVAGQPTATAAPPSFVNQFWTTNNGGQGWTTANMPVETNQDFLCPVSTFVAPDLAHPHDVFLLATHGAANLLDPTAIKLGQDRFELWRSQDGAQTWQKLTVPRVPNPINPVILSPFHLMLLVDGNTLLLGSNQSGVNFLFLSPDGGVTWQQVPGIPLSAGNQPIASDLIFAGFAVGPNNSLLALTNSLVTPAATNPYDLWQTTNDAKTWKKLSTPPLNLPAGATTQAQLFAAPGGSTLFVLAHFVPTTNAPTGQTVVVRSTDGGVTWANLGWPTAPSSGGVGGTPAPAVALGGATIASLGTGFAVDARGDAFIAPSNSDVPAQQDAQGPNSAGFFEAAAGQTQWTSVATPPAPQDTAFSLAISLTTADSLLPTATPDGTGTATASPTPTVTATATPGATPTATPLPGSDGLPTLWSNFGPFAQFTTDPNTAGFFENILP